MTSLCWKLKVALALVLSIIHSSDMSSAAVVAKDSDGRPAGPGDDQPAPADLKPSTNCDSHSLADEKTISNRLRRSLDRQQATPGEYFRYKQRGDVDDDADTPVARSTSRRQSPLRSSAMSDLLKRNWEDIAMSAWG